MSRFSSLTFIKCNIGNRKILDFNRLDSPHSFYNYNIGNKKIILTAQILLFHSIIMISVAKEFVLNTQIIIFPSISSQQITAKYALSTISLLFAYIFFMHKERVPLYVKLRNSDDYVYTIPFNNFFPPLIHIIFIFQFIRK